MSDNKILLSLNTFGPFLQKTDIQKLKTAKPSEIEKLIINQVEWFFGMPVASIKDEYLNRYLEVTNKDTHLNMAPAYKEIISRIINPIIYGKKYYCMAEYISCISMSGLVAEMLAILVWKISEFSIKSKKISKEQERGLFGNDFEKLGQERRIDILLTMQTIDEEVAKKFNEIRNIRRKYLHLWEYSTQQQKGDAKKCILGAMDLFKRITNMGLSVDKDGKQTVNINPMLLKYLTSQISK